MWTFRTLPAAGCALLALAVSVGPAGAAAADPPQQPRPADIVGVGSDTSEVLFDTLSAAYNRQLGPGEPRLASWWSTGVSPIRTKAPCRPIERPNGTSPGRLAILARQVLPGGRPCIDFYRTIAGRLPGDPQTMVYAPFALDSVTWAANAVTHAPASLTVAQLSDIVQCRATTWDQVGGRGHHTIEVYLPEPGPGLDAFLQRLIGTTAVGPCVRFGLQQDQGVDPVLVHSPDAMVFYAVGKYLAQTAYHHDDVHGNLRLKGIEGTQPVVANPATGRTEINVGQAPGVPAAPASFLFLESVGMLANADGTLPAALDRLFVGADAWICTEPTARAAILDHGLLPPPPGLCGQRQ